MNSQANLPKAEPHQRQTNIELLRIIAMLIIVAHHFSIHSNFNYPINSISFTKLWIQFIQIGGKIGVNVFVLISGYFLISEESFKTRKLLKIWVQIFFYSILSFIIFTTLGLESFSIKELIHHLAPITFSQWWFASAYFILYLLTPYINKLLLSLEKEVYLRFILLLFFIWCIIPTFSGQYIQCNTLLWFVFLYSLAAFFKRFGIKTPLSGLQLICLSIIVITLTFLSVVLFDVLGTRVILFANCSTYFYDMQRLPILLISTLMFFGFLKLNIQYNSIINLISSATFGVYLIHDNSYVRNYLWLKLFTGPSLENNVFLIPYSLFVTLIVFIRCTLIKLARIIIIEKKYLPLIKLYSLKIDLKINDTLKSIQNRFFITK